MNLKGKGHEVVVMTENIIYDETDTVGVSLKTSQRFV